MLHMQKVHKVDKLLLPMLLYKYLEISYIIFVK